MLTGPASTVERCVRMANQIALNLATQAPDDAARATAEHMRAFWDPRMKRLIGEAADAGAPLSPIAAEAVALLRGPAPADNVVARGAGRGATEAAPSEPAER